VGGGGVGPVFADVGEDLGFCGADVGALLEFFGGAEGMAEGRGGGRGVGEGEGGGEGGEGGGLRGRSGEWGWGEWGGGHAIGGCLGGGSNACYSL